MLAGAATIPVAISLAGRDSFRLPKTLLYRAEAIVLVALLAVALLARKIHLPSVAELRKPLPLLLVAIAGWTFITSMTAINRLLSMPALVNVLLESVVFLMMLRVARTTSIRYVYAALIPALINAVLVSLQALRIWNPIAPGVTGRAAVTGLLGNSDDAGGFLLFGAIAAMALWSVTRRAIAGACALLLVGGVILAQSLAAICALFAGTIVLGVTRWRRRAVVATAVVIALALVAVAVVPPLRHRADALRASARSGDYNALFSGRITPLLAGLLMLRDHPLTGVGPACYGYAYFSYKPMADERFGLLRDSKSFAMNFAEAHNDHIQIAAESGIVGYALFVAALFVVARPATARTANDESERARFARAAALPFVVALAVSALAYFPLQLAATRMTCLFFGAAFIAWREADAVA